MSAAGSESQTPTPRLPGRPRLSDAQEEAIRADLVAVARELFATEGYQSVSMRRIAERAGCAAPSLYRYFASKWELLRFVWNDVLEDAFVACDRAVVGVDDPVEHLRAYLLAYGRHWLANPELYSVIFTIQDRLLARGDRYFVEWPGAIERFAHLAVLVRRCMDAGRIARSDSELVAKACFCTLQGLVGTTITIPELPWGSRDAVLECGVDLLFRGLVCEAGTNRGKG